MRIVGYILLLITSYVGCWAQDIMVQVKTMDQNLRPYPKLEISINQGEVHKMDKHGIAFVELNSDDLPPKSITVSDKHLEAESWNFSKGILEVVVRQKTYQEIELLVFQGNQPVSGATVILNTSPAVSSTSNADGKLSMTIPIDTKLSKRDQLTVKGYQVTDVKFERNQGRVQVIPIPKPAEERKAHTLQASDPLPALNDIDEVEKFNFDYLDSIQSLTVFYSVIKNISTDGLDESMRRRVDAKFYDLMGAWEDSLDDVKTIKFQGRISDSSLVKNDIQLLIEQARAEDRSLQQIGAQLDKSMESLREKLSKSDSRLIDSDQKEIYEGIARLNEILNENERKFFHNQAQFRALLKSLAGRLDNIGELEAMLSKSEYQRIEQTKDFEQKLMTAIAISMALALFGIISFTLYNKFKKQKNQLTKANAEVKRVNEHLEELVATRTKQLQETNKELDTFLYKSSHDLRRPLTSIVGLSNIAKLTLDDRAQELFDRAANTARNMDRMLKKLININDIHHPSRYSPIDFHAQIGDTIFQCNELITQNQVKVNSHIQKGISFNSYPDILKIIIWNLLENAVWFSALKANQRPIVDIDISQQNGHINIQLRDNGPGVDPHIQDKIWDMFFVGHEKSNGNGLGLYLAQKATKVLSGSIHLHSDQSTLTTFEVRLPVNGS